MLDVSKLRAIGMMAARQARERATQADVTAHEVIDMAPLLTPWRPGSYAAGDVVAYAGAPYRCAQAHDSTGNEGWTPHNAPALWAPYHGTDRAHALPWQTPTGAQDAYQAGEWMVFTDGIAYRCKQAGTVWGPDTLADAWEAAQ